MTHVRTVVLCGVPVKVFGPANLWPQFPDAGPGVRPLLEVHVAQQGPVPKSQGHCLFEGPAFAVFDNERSLELVLRDEGVPHIWARLQLDADEVEVVLAPSATTFQERLRDEVLPELIVAHLWPRWGKAYLHASGTVGDGRVRLFLGPSGEGKTTAARQLEAAGDARFGEDRCVAWCDEVAWAASAPWHGGLPGVGTPVRLGGFFILRRQGEAGLHRLSSEEGLALLARNAFMPRWWRPGVEAALDALSQLAREVPVWTLTSPIAELARNVVEAGVRA